MSYEIKKDDILKRIYFIVKLIQNQKGTTMQGALTSKSDSMGGIFDRFINSIAEDVVFEKILIPELHLPNKITVLKDYYLYNPSQNGAGIAPDIFGIKVDDKKIKFVEFDKKWAPVKGMPQIEVKTFKIKDQMITLRNQDYDSEYIVMTDLNLRIDYLVPFLNKTILNEDILKQMEMDDKLFIMNDPKNEIKKVTPVDYSSDVIGSIDIISITKGEDFMQQATFCGRSISPRRVKNIIKRTRLSNRNPINKKLSEFCNVSPRVDSLYEFNENWYEQTKIDRSKIICLDFCATNLQNIEVCTINKNSIVVKALGQGCSFNKVEFENRNLYCIEFDTLDRRSNEGTEYFMQKQCATHLKSLKTKLLNELLKIIKSSL